MPKGYETENESSFYKRLYQDFNLYGVNLNNKIKEEIEDINKYGKVH